MKQFSYSNKYVLNFRDYNNSYGKSYDIYQDKLRLHDRVVVGLEHEEHGGKEGTIIPEFDKEDSENLITVQFDNNKKAKIHKGYLKRLSSQYSKNDRQKRE